MNNIIVKASRHRVLMVPAVTLMAVSIGISGYYIQDKKIVAKKKEEIAVKSQQAAAQQTQKIESKQSEPETNNDQQAASDVPDMSTSSDVTQVNVEIETEVEFDLGWI